MNIQIEYLYFVNYLQYNFSYHNYSNKFDKQKNAIEISIMPILTYYLDFKFTGPKFLSLLE